MGTTTIQSFMQLCRAQSRREGGEGGAGGAADPGARRYTWGLEK